MSHTDYQQSPASLPISEIARNSRRGDQDERRLCKNFTAAATMAQGENEPTTQPKNGLGNARFIAMPKIRRISMVPSPLELRPLRRLWRSLFAKSERSAKKPARIASAENSKSAENRFLSGWRQAAWRRRIVLAFLVVAQTAVAGWSLSQTFPGPKLSNLEIAILANFAVLFSWISFSFWTSVAAFCTLWRKSKLYSLADGVDELTKQPLRSRTAVLMPVCNEDAARCFGGIEAIYRSLCETGEIEKFDFYVLSDTGDADRQVEEEIAWAQTCEAIDGFGRIFYRHRRNNIKRKSGNIGDFLRRWGRNYEFMIVLDADSIMSGEILVRLARLMDRHPQVGIIQTAPTSVNSKSLFARVQQFASRVYGPLFSASLHFWQLGESYYWGHDAILRVAPFIKHCGLARLSGQAPLGGEILSHDFVEAALMGRAGWEVWLVDNLSGSYEESPPSLLDELKRDRRWCQGNLQHLRLLLGDHIRFGHRAMMAIGVMAYASAFFWAIFLILTSAEVAAGLLVLPDYFPERWSLFPLWPIWHPEVAIALLTTTALLLVLPKILSFLLILKNRQAAHFGGPLRLAIGIAVEFLLSTSLAPIRMWFHSKFVLLTLLGRQIKWGAQRRNEAEIGWLEALRQHGVSMAFALAWISAAYWLNESFIWWLFPVCGPLMLSVPLSVYSSRVRLGRALRDWKLLLIPEEGAPIEVLERLHAALDAKRGQPAQADLFMRAAVAGRGAESLCIPREQSMFALRSSASGSAKSQPLEGAQL